MTADPIVATRPAEGSRFGGRWWVVGAFLVLLGVLPLVGHGCHGDDVDHEPLIKPPVYNQE